MRWRGEESGGLLSGWAAIAYLACGCREMTGPIPLIPMGIVMAISVSCACGKRLGAPDEMAGKQAKCPACKAVVMLPDLLEVLEDEAAEAVEVTVDATPQIAPAQTALDRRLSGDAVAANPGNVRVDYLFAWGHNPRGTLGVLAFGMVCLGLAVWGFTIGDTLLACGLLLLGAVTLGACGWSWYAFGRLMIHGYANPAVVVDAASGLVAVMTDLDSGLGEKHWVVKIIQVPLARMTGAPAEDGMRLGTVGSYMGHAGLGHWQTFEPWLVNLLTRDKKTIRAVLGSFPASDWARLEAGLAEVPTPHEKGQWRVLEAAEKA